MRTLAADWWRPEAAPKAEPQAEGSALSPVFENAASPLAYAALLGFTFSLLLAPQNFFPVLGKLRLVLLMGAIAIVAHTQNRWALGLPVTKPARETKLALGLLVVSLLGMPFSLWPGGSLALLLDLYIKALAVLWMIGNLVDTLPRLRGMGWMLTALTFVLSLVGILNYTSGVFGQTLDRRIVGYDAGLTRNPNDLALMINLIIPISLALLLSSSEALMRLALTVAICIQIVAVILTFSRAGFLTLATTLGIFGFRLLFRPSRGLVFAALFAVVFALPFAPSGYTDRLLTLSAIGSDPTGSAQARWEGTLAAVEHAVEHPILGAGLGMNILVLNESVGATWRAVHNTYLEYAVDLGLPGLILFVMLLWACLKGTRAVRKRAGGEVGQLAEGIEISLLGFAVAAFFHPAAYEFYFFYIAGLALAVKVVGAREVVSAREIAVAR